VLPLDCFGARAPRNDGRRYDNKTEALGWRESGTSRLDEAVAAYREALTELTEIAVPCWHGIAQKNLDQANALLAERPAASH
jgi:hypothetical protein